MSATAPAHRAASVDILRGFALCGILFINIIAFARYSVEYMNPTAAGPIEGPNFIAWLLSAIFIDMKFISIFSMLFGAGLVLLGDRLEQREGAQGFAAIYYRRIAWLFLFGMLHAWLLWYGDILVSYAICGLALYPMRRLAPRTLAIIGSCLLLVPIFIFALLGVAMHLWFVHGGVQEALAARDSGATLTAEQSNTISMWADAMKDWAPSPEVLAAERAAYSGSWFDAFKERAEHNIFMQLFMIPMFSIWRCGGLMLIGMALMKLGVFSAQRSTAFYTRLAIIGLLTGLPLCALAAWDSFRDNFTYARTLGLGFNLNYVGSLGMSLAYVACIMLLYRSSLLSETTLLGRSFAAMGRMAFTNYHMQTLLCTTIFYGYGLNQFASWERWQLVFIFVPALLAVQLIYSPLWLARFRMGPAEWLWRTLTYWRPQPMRREPATLPQIG
jgi:uncharacterized protein